MFKKLCLVLVLMITLVIGPIGGGVMAAEEGEVCTLKQGMRIIQMMPGRSMRGVLTPGEQSIDIGPELKPDMVAKLDALDSEMRWAGGNMGMVEVDFGAGPVPVMVIVKDSDVKDCK